MKQSRKLEGSFTNYLMGNNSTTPEVGKGATLLFYSDRKPAEVLEVSADGKRCVIREMEHKAKPNAAGMGHQDWEVTPNPNGYTQTIVYRHGAWRKIVEIVEFEDAWLNSFATKQAQWDEEKRIGLRDENGDAKLIEGVTKLKRYYDKVNILFGRAEYHYDWEF